jgi:hypothetical protein
MLIRKIFAGVLLVAVALITIPTVFVRSITSTYLNPDFYDGEVVDESYEYGVPFLSKTIYEDPRIADYYTVPEVDTLVRKYFSIDHARDLAKDFATQLKSVIDGRKDDMIVVSLEDSRAQVKPLANEVSNDLVSGIEMCEEEDDLKLYEVSTDELPRCIPVEDGREKVKEIFKKDLERDMNNVISTKFEFDLTAEGQEDMHLKQFVQVFKSAQTILPLFLIIGLLFIILVIYKPKSLIAKFVALALFLGGVLSLITSQFISRIPEVMVTADSLPGYQINELEDFKSFYNFLLEFVVEKMMLYSFYFIGVGIVIFVLGLYFAMSEKKKNGGENEKIVGVK